MSSSGITGWVMAIVGHQKGYMWRHNARNREELVSSIAELVSMQCLNAPQVRFL